MTLKKNLKDLKMFKYFILIQDKDTLTLQFKIERE